MIIEAREDTITLRGELKSNVWPAIQAAAALLMENYPTGIIIDCSDVTDFSARGAATFADALRYIQSQGARILVAGLTEELMENWRLAQAVRSNLPIAATVDEARASLRLEELSPKRGKAKLAAVVPILGNWRRGIYLAQKLAMGESCEIHLVDLIKVPLALPLATPLPERETAGQALLDAAEAAVKSTGLDSFAHVQRARSNADGLIHFVDELKSGFAVVSFDRGEKSDPHIDEPEAMSLLEAASFEVSLVRGAPANTAQPVREVVIPAIGAWEHALDHACKLACGEDAVVKVIYLIQVPKSQPIDAPDADAEAAASDCAKEARRIARRYGVKVETITERVRDTVLGFLNMFESHHFDLAVVGVKRETGGDYHIAHAAADALLHRLPCETVFLRTAD